MKKKIFTVGAVCALILTACGKANHAVQTSGNGTSDVGASRQATGKIQVEQVDSQVITVNSRETVKVVPDMAEIVYGVTNQHTDAAVCQRENSEKVEQLVEALKALGVAETAIQTANFDMNPRYDWDQGGKIVGYEASVQVVVSDIQLEQVGEMIMKAVDSGVNQIQSVSFLSSHYDESYREALKLAVAQAQEKAQALADASGCTLGRAVHISEHYADDNYRYTNQAFARGVSQAEKYMADEAVVMPGEIEIEAVVSIDFAIQ